MECPRARSSTYPRCSNSVNAFLLERGGRRALIDAGAGHTMGPTLGADTENLLAELGFSQRDVDELAREGAI